MIGGWYETTPDGGPSPEGLAYLPSCLVEWAGLSSDSPEVPGGVLNTGDPLAYLNDGGTSFAEIADLIEEHL